MAKAQENAFAFLQKAKTSKEPFKESFEVTAPASMSSFRGLFGHGHLSDIEEARLMAILQQFSSKEEVSQEDFVALSRITSEIKSIGNQSLLLHGERVKRAQEVLKQYKEGAFTAWLLATYGNRQTPYSMLQYYELYVAIPESARRHIENMPKKAVYTLAARKGTLEKKTAIIEQYRGETQKDLIIKIQQQFPCAETDKRKRCFSIVREFEHLVSRLEKMQLTASEKEEIRALIMRCQHCV